MRRIHHSKTEVEAVEYEDRDTGQVRHLADVTDVVVAAGPWTGRLLPKTKVEGLRAHSVVWQAHVSPYAVFTDIDLPKDFVPDHRARAGQKRRHLGRVDPEIYARPFGEVYACGRFLSLSAPPRGRKLKPSGEPDRSIPLPETADLVQCDEAQCDDIIAYTATISPVLAAAAVKAKQACYLPRHVRGSAGDEAGPLVGPTTVAGLWVASGHTCWGIQNGPATGRLMAEFILDGRASSADIDELSPKRFRI